MSGKSWEGIRTLLRNEYACPLIVSIAEQGSHSRSFSADTGMAECLFVGRKEQPTDTDEIRAMFVVLNAQPQNTLEGEQLAHAISRVLDKGNVRRLEDGPFGGTRIQLGDSCQGEILDCPLPSEGAWQTVGICDITLGQTAYQMTSGRLWVEGMSADAVVDISVAPMADVIRRVGPHHLDIAGAKIKADGLPQGPFEHLPGAPQGAAYPCLWNHNAKRERQLIVKPDSHCKIREVNGTVPKELVSKAHDRWSVAARAHYNLDLRFNSQSLVVAMTEQPSIGGRAWPTVLFDKFCPRIRICHLEQFHTRFALPLVDVQQITGWSGYFYRN